MRDRPQRCGLSGLGGRRSLSPFCATVRPRCDLPITEGIARRHGAMTDGYVGQVRSAPCRCLSTATTRNSLV